MADYSTPLGKFEQQHRQAKQRSIDWLLTFDEWWAIWQEFGRWEQRGKKIGQYVMARRGDVGPYSVGNVYICLASENHSHAHSNGRVPVKPKKSVPHREPRVIRGWTYIRRKSVNPYQVMYAKKYIGSFATQHEAEAAYVAALELAKAVIHESSFVG